MQQNPTSSFQVIGNILIVKYENSRQMSRSKSHQNLTTARFTATHIFTPSYSSIFSVFAWTDRQTHRQADTAKHNTCIAQ